ncbi:MAG: hypothetical protein IPQ16_13565 [Geobacteraceae bacterium]|nr:hypothetical protein [Geobacteraceae bacterium]
MDRVPGRQLAREFRNKKEERRALLWESNLPVIDKATPGQFPPLSAVTEDITNRKVYETELLVNNNTEELLLKHNEMNRMFDSVTAGKREWEDTMDSIPEMVLMCDPSGTITRCNRIGLLLYRSFIHPDTRTSTVWSCSRKSA